eukprot:11442398-Alexandrium_andersonii.AAC.1
MSASLVGSEMCIRDREATRCFFSLPRAARVRSSEAALRTAPERVLGGTAEGRPLEGEAPHGEILARL